jgi:hypothetical protein
LAASCRASRRVEGPDGEFAPREDAPLVAIHHREPHSQIPNMKRRRAGVRDHLLGGAGETSECRCEEIMARAADAEEIDLRLRHRLREFADLSIGGWIHFARQGIDLGRRRGIGENRQAQAVTHGVARRARLAGRCVRTAAPLRRRAIGVASLRTT